MTSLSLLTGRTVVLIRFCANRAPLHCKNKRIIKIKCKLTPNDVAIELPPFMVQSYIHSFSNIYMFKASP